MADARPGRLYIVATPIGNLEDLGRRAERTLREVAWVACEDTRVTHKLLEHYGIEARTTALHAHSEPEAVERVLGRLLSGDDVALVSDAGTPLVSDPGQALVDRAIAVGVQVVPIPGPSASLAALMGAGLPTAKVLFLGFLPREDAARREVLSPLREAPYTLVLYEAPPRVPQLLEALLRSLGDRPACLARELTKRFETLDRGRLGELVERHSEPPRGEVVLVVGPPDRVVPAEESIRERARREAARLLSEGVRPAEAAKLIAGALGLAKNEAYQIVLSAKG
jgi:16S rRNA (cytidine1402-2'-O)-methyltransferase